MGASQSRLAKAGGDPQLAAQSLAQEYAAGAKGWSAAQKAAYEDPATRDAWVAQQIGQSTKGKYSGVLGTIAKTAMKVAPIGAAFIPGIGPLAAAGLAAGASAGGRALAREPFSLGQTVAAGAGGGIGNALMGGQGIGALVGRQSIGAAGKEGLAGLVKGGAAASGGGGILGSVGGGILDFIKAHPERALQLGLGGLGAIQASKAQGRANDLTQRALAPLGGPNPFGNLPVDTGNPYAQQDPRLLRGQQSLNAMLSR